MIQINRETNTTEVNVEGLASLLRLYLLKPSRALQRDCDTIFDVPVAYNREYFHQRFLMMYAKNIDCRRYV